MQPTFLLVALAAFSELHVCEVSGVVVTNHEHRNFLKAYGTSSTRRAPRSVHLNILHRKNGTENGSAGQASTKNVTKNVTKANTTAGNASAVGEGTATTTLPPKVEPARRTCESITPLDWVACGSPTISKCACASLGGCWGADNPFVSTLVDQSFKEIPPCYYRYGGLHAIPAQEFSAANDTYTTLKFPIDLSKFEKVEDASKLRFIIIPGHKSCGYGSLADAVKQCSHPQVIDLGVSIGVKVQREGSYKICMNDDFANKGADHEQFFTVFIGRLQVIGDVGDSVMTSGPGGCPR